MSSMRKVMKLLFPTKMLHRKGMQLANNVILAQFLFKYETKIRQAIYLEEEHCIKMLRLDLPPLSHSLNKNYIT